MIHLRSGAATLVGQVRAANEDSHFVGDDLAVVADGMGGHRAGEVASELTVEVLSGMAGRRALADLVLAVHTANRNITDRAADNEALRGMGTTVCVVGMVDEDGEHVAVLNVGDSRVYLSAAGALRRLTEDHSLVETLVREGRITEEEAEVHPQRNVLTRALGVEALVVVDAWLLRPCEGDRLLLCSDGLFNELAESRIAEVLAEGDDPEVTARRLAAEAEAAGGRDNITAVVVDLVDALDPPEPLDGRFRRIATPTVDLDDTFHDPVNDTATVPLVPIFAAPPVEADRDEGDEGDWAEGDEGDWDEGDRDEGDRDEGDEGDRVGDAAAPGHVDDTERAAGSDADTDGAGPDELDPDAPAASGPAVPEPDGSTPGNADMIVGDNADDASPTRRSWRTPAFVLAVLLIIGGAFGIVLYTAGLGWFVGADDATVAVYRGQPDGFLWVQPQVEQSSDVVLAKLSPKDQRDVREGKRFTSRSDAERYVANLLARTTTTTTTTTTTSTTTTAPTTTAPPAPADPVAPPPGPAPPAPGSP